MKDTAALAAPRTVARRSDGLLDAVWHFFCSPKIALLLILGIALASWSGTMLMQAPAAVVSSPPDYQQWLLRAQERYGAFFTQVFYRVGLFDIFNAVWFRGLILLLITNIVVCSINRWKTIWHGLTYKRVMMGDGYYQAGSHSFAVTYAAAGPAPEAALEGLQRALRRGGYRVRTEMCAGVQYLYGDRHPFARLGTYATHLSIVLLLAGVTAGGLGFREEGFVVPEGTSQPVGHGTELSLYLDDFTDEWYLNDTPKDYRSDVVLYDNGVEVREATIRVNQPLEYQGIRFHQSFYGNAAVMQVRDRDGNALFDAPVALPWRTRPEPGEREGRPLGDFSIPGRDLVAYILLPSGPGDSQVLPGQVWLELYAANSLNRPLAVETLDLKQPKTLGDLQFTFLREKQFTGLQVVSDPGSPVVWVASFLLVLGNVVVLSFPPRQLWARCGRDEDGRTALRVRALASRDRELDRDLRGLRSRMEALGPTSDERRGASDGRRATSNGRRGTSNERRATSGARRSAIGSLQAGHGRRKG